ncbi:MAG: exopolysaccharide biosynthesis protein [Dongiaceae bacterium]
MTTTTLGETTSNSRRRTSDILRSLVANDGCERLSVRDIETALGERSFGVILLVVALFGIVPGVSMVAAIALLPICVQMILGADQPWLPAWMQARSAKRADFAAVADRFLPFLEKFEGVLRPRYRLLTEKTTERVVGAVCLVLALFLLPPLPIPFSNMPFAISIVVLALSIIERDGLLLAIGLVCGAAVIGGTLVLGWVAVHEALLWPAKYLGM